jgi:hypothetical protein
MRRAAPPAASHFANHHKTRVNADTDGELHAFLALQTWIERRRDSLDNTQARMQGALRIIFMGLGPAKIHQ